MQKNELDRLGFPIVFAAALAMSGCGGSGGGATGGTIPAPMPSATTPGTAPPPPGPSSQTITASTGSTNGQTGGYSPAEGDTTSGGQGQPVDGTTCDAVMSNNYHVHAFIGVYNNGTLMALPAGVGMQAPQAPVNGFVNSATCFYHIHTHDQSGIIHIEDPNPNNVAKTASLYAFKTLLDIWGITADANHFGPFQGPVRVFTSGQTARLSSSTVTADTYTYFGNDPSTIPLYAHEVIFIEVGPNYPSSLPNVNFTDY